MYKINYGDAIGGLVIASIAFFAGLHYNSKPVDAAQADTRSAAERLGASVDLYREFAADMTPHTWKIVYMSGDPREDLFLIIQDTTNGDRQSFSTKDSVYSEVLDRYNDLAVGDLIGFGMMGDTSQQRMLTSTALSKPRPVSFLVLYHRSADNTKK